MPHFDPPSREHIEDAIAENRLDEALAQLRTLTSTAHAQYRNKAIQLTAKYSDIRRTEVMGLATQEETSVALNRVAFDILTLLTELEAGPVPSEAPVQAPSFEEDVRARPRFDKIIGINNLRQIGWIEHGLVASRAVCRILTPGGLGTGFLIDQFVLMTNNHVIPSSNVADQTKVEFNYQLALGLGGNCAL